MKAESLFGKSVTSHLRLINETQNSSSDLSFVDSIRTINFKKGLTIAEVYEKLKDNPIKNGNTFTYLTIHELGHTLGQIHKELYDNFLELTKTKGFDKNVLIKEFGNNVISINNEISKGELFADAFADCVLNKEKASKTGKLIPEFLKKQGII